MRKSLRIAALILLTASVICLSACGKTEANKNTALEYLKSKYQDKSFEITYSPSNRTITGRYELTAVCLDDGTEFEIYLYSIMKTDSYSVIKANASAEKQIRERIGDEYLSMIETIEAYPVFSDGGTDYRFSEITEEKSIDELTRIDKISLKNVRDSSEASKDVVQITMRLNEKGITLDEINYEFNIDGFDVRFTTSSSMIIRSGSDDIVGDVYQRISEELAKAKEDSLILITSKTVSVNFETEPETSAQETETTKDER